MSSDSPTASGLTPREVMEEKKRRLLESAAEVDREWEIFERICMENRFVVVVQDAKIPPREQIPRSDFERAQREAESILRVSGRPMWIEELLPAVIKRGILLNGKDPANVLIAYLHRNKNLRFMKDYGWWIADVPWPPGSELPAAVNTAEDNPSLTYVEHKQRNKESIEAALAAAREYLTGKKEPVRLREIYRAILAKGHTIPSKEPTLYLSQLLGKNGFHVHGRSGWSLDPLEGWEPPDTPERRYRETARKKRDALFETEH